ncbi:MAG: Holliday junction branch migration protein RuvA [Bacteroidia bacterium]|nr:Holliday junction branch migration protein RuvA [Bacteroidia bacterium]
MYEFIEGNLESLTPTHAVIECQGIGYFTHISLNTFEAVKSQKQVRLFIEQVFKVENQSPVSIQLYGFADPNERQMFRQLTSISGVGNNTAIIMLSSLDPDTLISAILNGNVGLLKSIKGIGEKTAQRIVLELRDKLAGKKMTQNLPGLNQASDAITEAMTALTVLGYQKAAAEKALLKISKDLGTLATVEELIKNSLKIL